MLEPGPVRLLARLATAGLGSSPAPRGPMGQVVQRVMGPAPSETTAAPATVYIADGRVHSRYEMMDGVFGADECAQLVTEILPLLGPRRTEASYYSVRTTPLAPNAFEWVYTRVAAAMQAANQRAWQFSLDGFFSLTGLVYEPGDEVGWHRHLVILRGGRMLKLACSVLLSPPDAHEGGQLELFVGCSDGADAPVGPGPTTLTVPLDQRGSGAAFPSYTAHRVTPISRGQRVILVAGATGPAFA